MKNNNQHLRSSVRFIPSSSHKQENMLNEQSLIRRTMMMLWSHVSATLWRVHVPQCSIKRICMFVLDYI